MFITPNQLIDEGTCLFKKLWQLINEHRVLESEYHHFTTPNKLMGLGIDYQEKRVNQPLCVSQRTQQYLQSQSDQTSYQLGGNTEHRGCDGQHQLSAIHRIQTVGRKPPPNNLDSSTCKEKQQKNRRNRFKRTCPFFKWATQNYGA